MGKERNRGRYTTGGYGLCIPTSPCERCRLQVEYGPFIMGDDEEIDDIKAKIADRIRSEEEKLMSTIFQKEAYQYEHANVALPTYLKKYKDSEWECRSTIRKDTLERCRLGLPVKKVVLVRRPREIEVTPRQMELTLLAMNQRKAFNGLSRDILFCINKLKDGFNSGDVALILFGPSDKYYEKGRHEQNIKRKVRRLEHHNVLVLRKQKYYKPPVWKPLIKMIEEADKRGRFKRTILM